MFAAWSLQSNANVITVKCEHYHLLPRKFDAIAHADVRREQCSKDGSPLIFAFASAFQKHVKLLSTWRDRKLWVWTLPLITIDSILEKAKADITRVCTFKSNKITRIVVFHTWWWCVLGSTGGECSRVSERVRNAHLVRVVEPVLRVCHVVFKCRRWYVG